MSDDNFFEVRAYFDQYTGNFEREITAWVFGAIDEYMPGGWEEEERPHAGDLAWAYNEDGVEGTLKLQVDGEYGYRWCTIESGKEVIWHFEERPTPVELMSIVKAIKTFKVAPKSYNVDQVGPNLTGFEVRQISTLRTKIPFTWN